MKFLHLSDLHIHGGDLCPNQDIYDTLNFVYKNFPNHTIIITGDITDDGSPEQYKIASELLYRFKGRIFICPGNHDYGAAGNLYSPERAVKFDELATQLAQGGTFKGDETPVVNIFREDGDNMMLIALNSNLETESPFDFACGQIGEKQLNALATILTTNPSFTKILFFHHHPFYVNDPFMEMKDSKELAKVVYNKVDIVLFGHKHVMEQYENVWGIKYLLCSDNSPGKQIAKEIDVTNGKVSVTSVNIK